MSALRAKQPVVKVWLHSTSDASPPAALLLAHILPVFSVVAPCRRGASPVSVRRQTFTTGCYVAAPWFDPSEAVSQPSMHGDGGLTSLGPMRQRLAIMMHTSQ